MIEIKPTIFSQFTFQTCRRDSIVMEEVIFLGMHTLARCRCATSQQVFYHTFPTGHACEYPVAFSEDGQQTQYAPEAALWLARPLVNAFFGKTTPVTVQKVVHKTYDSVVILNCLDNCYGHMLYKLMHAARHLSEHPNLGLILLLPSSLLWLVLEGVAEVWWVDAPLRSLNQRLAGLDAFVKEEINRFERVYLSVAAMRTDTSHVSMRQLTKIAPFPLHRFGALPPTITFICREDRFWTNSQLAYYLYLAAVKFKVLEAIRGWFVYGQNRLIRSTVRHIQQSLPQAHIVAVGIGKTGRLGKDVQDERTVGKVSVATERRWCQCYAASHVVIGVHGSGMLIPSATAAAFIDLIPKHKIPHLGEDIIARHTGDLASFLGRFLPLPTSPYLVATHALNIIKHTTF